ncbi:MAG: hypothetical protein ABJA78_03165 [Ferruginibacter sp.]
MKKYFLIIISLSICFFLKAQTTYESQIKQVVKAVSDRFIKYDPKRHRNMPYQMRDSITLSANFTDIDYSDLFTTDPVKDWTGALPKYKKGAANTPVAKTITDTAILNMIDPSDIFGMAKPAQTTGPRKLKIYFSAERSNENYIIATIKSTMPGFAERLSFFRFENGILKDKFFLEL